MRLCHDDNILPVTWSCNDQQSRIDLIYVSNPLVSNFIYSHTSKPHIYLTDHKIVEAVFMNQRFINQSSIAQLKHNNIKVKKFDYSIMIPALWKDFADTTNAYILKFSVMLQNKYNADIRTINQS